MKSNLNHFLILISCQAEVAQMEGFVVIDPANHTFNMNHTGPDASVNVYSNCVKWNDANGAVVYVTEGTTSMDMSYFKDIKVIYHRAYWHYWDGGRVISFRDRKPGNVINNVQIKNVLVEDLFPAFPPIYCKMLNPDNSSASIDYDNIIIESVEQEHPGVSESGDSNYGKPGNTMLGLDDARKFSNITFKNCYYNGKWLGSFADGDFLVNKHVENITFILDHVKHLISLSANNETGGSVSGDGFYTHGEKATVSAVNKIQLIDLTGKVVYTDNEVNLNKSIDTSEFITGLYILQIHSSNHVFTTKVMKK